jgi:opacity protein-like surface antigen
MKKLLLALLAVCALSVATAPDAKADCGYWATRYEQLYVPPAYIGVDLNGQPVYSPGYVTTRAIPYYVSRPCPPVAHLYIGTHRHGGYRHGYYHHGHRRHHVSVGLGFFIR